MMATHDQALLGAKMKPLWCIALFATCLFFPTYLQARPQQTIGEIKDSFAKHSKKIAISSKDLIEQQKHGPNTFEYAISASLIATGDNALNYLDSGLALILVYSSLSCPVDKEAAKPILKRQFASYAKYLESDIKNISANVANTKMLGTALTATNFRNELRELQGFFNSLSDSF
jgi:hypothetical protein